MNKFVYCVVDDENTTLAICENEADAQEMCLTLTFDEAYYYWLYNIHFWGDDPRDAVIPTAVYFTYYVNKFPLI